MKNFVYKLTKTKKMKLAGMIDTDIMTINIDGEDKRLSTLLSEYNGCEIEMTINVKTEEDLDEPVAVSDDE
ncbi:MAG: hypothetical protein ACLTWK_11945 [Eisenbergiella sp.]